MSIDFNIYSRWSNTEPNTAGSPPLSVEDSDYLAHFRAVCKRYNIIPSKANRLEYDFVTRVTDSEFYLQQAQA